MYFFTNPRLSLFKASSEIILQNRSQIATFCFTVSWVSFLSDQTDSCSNNVDFYLKQLPVIDVHKWLTWHRKLSDPSCNIDIGCWSLAVLFSMVYGNKDRFVTRLVITL